MDGYSCIVTLNVLAVPNGLGRGGEPGTPCVVHCVVTRTAVAQMKPAQNGIGLGPLPQLAVQNVPACPWRR